MTNTKKSLIDQVVDYVHSNGPVSSNRIFDELDDIEDKRILSVMLAQAVNARKLERIDAPPIEGSRCRVMYVKPGTPKSILYQPAPSKPSPTKPSPAKAPAAETQPAIEQKSQKQHVKLGEDDQIVLTHSVLQFVAQSSRPLSVSEIFQALPDARNPHMISKIINRLHQANRVITVPAPKGSGQGVRFLYTTPKHPSASFGLKDDAQPSKPAQSDAAALKPTSSQSAAPEAIHSTGFGYSRCIDGVVIWRGAQAFSLNNREVREFVEAMREV